MTYVGTVGEIALIDEDNKYHLAPNVAKITINDDKNNSATFLAHLLYYMRERIVNDMQSSALSMSKINLSKILQDVYSNRSRNGVELLTNYYFISKQLLYDCFYALTVCIYFFQNHYIYKCPCNLIQNTMDSFYFSWISMRDSISKISKYITSIIS